MPVDAKRVQSAFLIAIEVADPTERASALDRLCGDDAELRRRVDGLLSAHNQSAELPPAQGELMPATMSPTALYTPGATVAGRYKLLEQLGEGGMGTVWVAEQHEPVKRRVALKLIKPGMDSRQVLSRFEAERQALALMDHPNIAKVFDGGMTDEGRPYFVMEYVKGVPITEYCDSVRLSIKDRLKLFAQVCQAVQHAHQKGIIHRDLKPSNILVCLYDGQPVPKVIDFGLAKAISQPLTEHTLYTAHGLMVGTPLYMSPEQAEFNNLDVDTRTDIYSLGVTLYELLTGTTPLEKQQFKNAAFAEILRLIKEVEPQRPSLKISSSLSLPSIAAQRSLDPAQLSRAVRGDLDWIVMKALEKERSRRYETANGLARDIDRYLCDEPVEACPPSAGYRLKKLLRRNKGPALAAAIVLLTLVGGIIGTTWGLIRAENSRQQADAARASETARAEAEAQQRRRAEAAEATAQANERQVAAERDRAEQEARIAQAVKDFLQNRLLGQADPEIQTEALLKAGGTSAGLKPNPTIRELLDRAAAELTGDKIETQFPGLPLVQAEILRTIGATYMKLGEGDYVPGIDLLERSRDLYIRHLGADHTETMTTLSQLGMAYMRGRKLRDATQIFEHLRDKYMATLGPDHPETLTILQHLAHIYRDDARYQDAIRLSEQVRDKRIAVLGPDHLDSLTTLAHLATAYWQGGRPRDAIPLFEHVRDRRIALLGGDHPQTLWTLWGLAGAHDSLGDLPKAIELYEQILERASSKLGPDHLLTRYLTNRLATTYNATGRSSDALLLLEKSRAHNTAKFGPDHIATLSSIYNLAWAYSNAGGYAKAAQLFEQVREQRAAKLGTEHEDTLEATSGLAWSYHYMRRSQEAIELFEQVRSGLVTKFGPKHALLLSSLNGLGAAYHVTRQFPKAVESRKQYLDVVRQNYTAADPKLVYGLEALGQSLLRADQFTEAAPVLEEALEIREKTMPDSYLTFNAKSLLGVALLGQKKYADAEPLLLAAYEGLKQREVTIPANVRKLRLTEALQRLIDLYTAWDKPGEATKWRAELEILQPAKAPDAKNSAADNYTGFYEGRYADPGRHRPRRASSGRGIASARLCRTPQAGPLETAA